MGYSVLTEGYVVLHEVLFEKVSTHVLNNVFAEIYEGFALDPTPRLGHLFIDHHKLLFSAIRIVLVFQYLGEAMASNLLQLIVALEHEVHQHGYQVLVDLRHVEQVDCFC